MTAEVALQKLCDSLLPVGKSLEASRVETYLERLDRMTESQRARVTDHLCKRSKYFPSLPEVEQALHDTYKPELVQGQPVSKHRPWHTTKEAQLAIEAQERVIAMSDEEYEQALDDYRRRREAGVPLRAIPGGRADA